MFLGVKIMKKKFLAFILATAMTASLAGCGAKTVVDLEPTVMEKSEETEESVEAATEASEEILEAAEEASEAATEELIEEVASDEASVEASAEEEDEDSEEDLTIGKVTGNVYENQFFNLKFTLPSGYTFVDDDTLAQISGNLANYAGKNSKQVQESLDNGTTAVAAFATDSNGINNVSIALQGNAGIQNALVSEKSLLSLSQQQVRSSIESQGATVKDIVVEEKTVAGDSHYTLKVTGDVQGINFYEELITVQKGDYVILFTITNVNEDETTTFLNAIEKLN
jgi:predicted small lipoprotein YifL